MFNTRNYIIAGCVVVLIVGWLIFSPKKQNDTIQYASTPAATNTSGGGSSPKQDSAQGLYQEAVSLKNNGHFLEAKETYQKIMMDHPDFDNIETTQKELETLNMKIILSNTPTPKTVTHEVVSGDTLGELAKKYGTTVQLIKKKNNLKNDIIRIGQKLIIWTGQFNIFVDKSQNKLILKDEDGVVKVYDVSTGRNNGTPVGDFKVTTKLVDPVWFKSGAIVPPESPENELGSRWMGFDIPGYGIHGTIRPDSIGQQVTAGCVRMRNQEVEELYDLIPTGTKVKIVD
ncbi:MAG: L,D-transpeptidase family protein [Candidatus Omnitrophica bacterium]|nr:L,D-transpeptidase family protein [Candidatus Omnitrophota bacterium]